MPWLSLSEDELLLAQGSCNSSIPLPVGVAALTHTLSPRRRQ